MKKYVGLSFAAMLVLAGCGSTDGTYYGESAADEDGVVTTVEYTMTDGDITDVTFDAKGGEYGDSKVAYSEAGKYGMGEKTGGAEWHEQVADLDSYVEENDAFPETEANEDGSKQVAVDGTTSATIGLDGFKEAFDNAEVK